MYSVNYGPTVKVLTLIVGVLLLGMAVHGIMKHRYGLAYVIGMTVFPLSFLVSTALFTVLGYEVKNGDIYVVRPIGTKLIARDVVAITPDRDALDGATRTFGNGGMFSISGWFRLPKYGRARVWVTDTADLLVVRSRMQTAVISPRDKERFMGEFSPGVRHPTTQ